MTSEKTSLYVLGCAEISHPDAKLALVSFICRRLRAASPKVLDLQKSATEFADICRTYIEETDGEPQTCERDLRTAIGRKGIFPEGRCLYKQGNL
jgi:hypothetical protein